MYVYTVEKLKWRRKKTDASAATQNIRIWLISSYLFILFNQG